MQAKIKLSRMDGDTIVTEFLYILSITKDSKVSCLYQNHYGKVFPQLYSLDELYAVLLFEKPLDCI
jgi:hypothetical protein